MAERTDQQQAEVDQAKALIEQAFDTMDPREAAAYIGRISDLVVTRQVKRHEFNRELDQAMEDHKASPKVQTDKVTGRTIQPEGLQYDPLPITDQVSLSGKGLVESIKRGRPLPVGPDGRQWVRIAEDAPSPGPPMMIRQEAVAVGANRFLLKDLMVALAQKFGSVIPEGFEVVTAAAPFLSESEKDKIIDLMATRIAELEAGK